MKIPRFVDAQRGLGAVQSAHCLFCGRERRGTGVGRGVVVDIGCGWWWLAGGDGRLHRLLRVLRKDKVIL